MLTKNNPPIEGYSLPEKFCFISVRSILEFVSAVMIIIMATLLLIYSCMGYRSLRKIGKVMPMVKMIFLVVVLSEVCKLVLK